MTISKKKGKSKSTKEEQDFDNTNRGVLFENNEKKKKTHPDFKGSFTDGEGNEFWVAGWSKEARSGQEYISLAFTAKEIEEDDDEEIEEDEEIETPKKSVKRKK